MSPSRGCDGILVTVPSHPFFWLCSLVMWNPASLPTLCPRGLCRLVVGPKGGSVPQPICALAAMSPLGGPGTQPGECEDSGCVREEASPFQCIGACPSVS